MIFQFMDWYKWYVNPQMAKAIEEKQEGQERGASMSDDMFAEMVAAGLRQEGRTEEEIKNIMYENGFIKDFD